MQQLYFAVKARYKAIYRLSSYTSAITNFTAIITTINEVKRHETKLNAESHIKQQRSLLLPQNTRNSATTNNTKIKIAENVRTMADGEELLLMVQR
ncbi:hypothetical protein [Clostridium sp. Marseille-QA1073]